MPKISVVVPVYNAEKTLRRCVESIVFGEEKDLEIILLEDRSEDGSWALCGQLAAEYPQVICLQNDRNRGVAYTRNRGLDVATGRYLLFVDSDDWVCGRYAKALVTACEENPGKLVVCGFTFIDHTVKPKPARRGYGISDTTGLTRKAFYRLSEAVLLQQLWNKAFCLEEIRKAGVRFDETLSMGEDYRFVMDLIEALHIEECVIIPQLLYYYIRWGRGSLMDQWTKHESYEDALSRAMRLENLCGPDPVRLERFKEGFVYRIVREPTLTKKQKLATIGDIFGKEKSRHIYRKQQKIWLHERIWCLLPVAAYGKERILGKLHSVMNGRKIRKAANAWNKQEFTVLSQNCIGGVFSHDLGMPFRSPTVNAYFTAADFIKLAENPVHYLNAQLQLRWDEEYPVGKLDDIAVHFVHYDTCLQAREAWERRKERMDLNRVFVLSTDRDGFNEALFERWKKIPYPKLLLTACRQYADHEDSLYFPRHEKLGCVPDLIPKREFYRKNVLIQKINRMG